MMAKKILSKKSTRDLVQLVLYSLDAENDGEKVGQWFVNNCYSDDPLLALKEIEIVQARNTRAKTEKVFHMVVSFPEGEVPPTEQLMDIEQSMCEAAGLGHHQRISATHTNTDNFHLHVIINKIDPDTYKIVDKWRDTQDMMACCAVMEKKHNLTLEHWGERERADITKTAIDYHSGDQSLLSWSAEHVKPELEQAIQTARSWADIHRVFGQHGLSLELAGRGMVVKSGDIAIKASSLSRQLSLSKLSPALGAFKPAMATPGVAAKPTYDQRRKETLFEAYEAFKSHSLSERADKLRHLKARITKERVKLKLQYALARSAVKNGVMSRQMKRDAYRRHAANHRAAQKIVTLQYAKAREQVFKQHRSVSFRDYLKQSALDGDKAALAQLRKTSPARQPENSLTGKGDKVIEGLGRRIDKHGTLTYHHRGQDIADTGQCLSAEETSPAGLAVLLELAIKKYGRTFEVQGDETFKQAVSKAIAQQGLDIRVAGFKSPLEDFIDQRNRDRERVSAIPEHKPLGERRGSFTFEGYRNIRDVSVILLRRGNTLYVKPIERKELSHYKSLKKGVTLTVGHAQGQELDNGWELD